MPYKKTTNRCIRKLQKQYPNAKFYLTYNSPLELLIATLLSQKVKDEVVKSILPRLFTKYKSANDYAQVPLKQLSQEIIPISFATIKARRIKEVCKILVEKYYGKVPDNMQELLNLPGVGRKTANTILINAFDIVEGIAVDTNVARISFRLGWTRSRNPDKIERDLMSAVPKRYWKSLPYLMKAHGRAICKPKLPECRKCVLFDLCKRKGVYKYK